MGGQYMFTGVPLPLLTLAKKGYEKKQEVAKMKKIREFLDYGKK
jgi:hypothetical protein